MKQDLRLNDITDWLQTRYPSVSITLTPIQGDASFRRYFRTVINKRSYIVMDSPPKTEPVLPFIQSTQRLNAGNISVPQIHQENRALGCLLLDDFGTRDYFKTLTFENSDHYYKKAIDELIKIQACSNDNALPLFDKAHIKRELSLFSDWFLDKHLGIKNVNLGSTFDFLADSCLEQPYTTIHRDYHCRNIMILDDDSVGIIDHQDIMCGPLSYDLVSLLKDCYIDWPESKIKAWVSYFLSASPYSCDNFYPLFELTGVQRHLKAIGIFSRLAHLYDNSNFLKYIPRTLKYVQIIADKEPNLKELSTLIKRI